MQQHISDMRAEFVAEVNHMRQQVATAEQQRDHGVNVANRVNDTLMSEARMESHRATDEEHMVKRSLSSILALESEHEQAKADAETRVAVNSEKWQETFERSRREAEAERRRKHSMENMEGTAHRRHENIVEQYRSELDAALNNARPMGNGAVDGQQPCPECPVKQALISSLQSRLGSEGQVATDLRRQNEQLNNQRRELSAELEQAKRDTANKDRELITQER